MADLTFTFFEALQAAGVPQDKAKAVIETLNQAIDSRYAIHARELATRGDIEKVRADMAILKFDLIKWIVGTGASAIVILYGLIRTIPH
jgi:hypothetical protein